MENLLTIIAEYLVDDPDSVSVTVTPKERSTLLELRVAPADMGKVIGRGGRIARAIRTVVKAGASRLDKSVIVEITQ